MTHKPKKSGWHRKYKSHKYDGHFYKFPYKLAFGKSDYNAYYYGRAYFVKWQVYSLIHDRFITKKTFLYKSLESMQKKVRQLYKTKRWQWSKTMDQNWKKAIAREKAKSKARKKAKKKTKRKK